MYVDIEISADGTLSLEEGHEIAQKVHDAVEKEFSAGKTLYGSRKSRIKYS